jgi:hypothetical protein
MVLANSTQRVNMKASTTWISSIKNGTAALLSAIAIAALAVLGTASTADAQGFAVNVIGDNTDGTTTAIPAYWWTLEEDRMYHVTPGVSDPNTSSVNFHASYMPVVATGDESDVMPTLDPAKHYFFTVVPRDPWSDYSIGGGAIAPGDTSVSITVVQGPLPTAQISLLVFNDNYPTNGAPDLPVITNLTDPADNDAGSEEGLPDFKCFLEEPGGMYGMAGGVVQFDTFGNNIGTSYLRNPDGTPILDGDGAPIVDVQGSGYVVTDTTGQAFFKNIAPAKYGVLCVPPAGENWQQTSTIEGSKVIDAWVQPNEPKYFKEFGPPAWHVFMGFVQPFADATALTGGETITGRVTNLHTERPPAVGFSSSEPRGISPPWVALNVGQVIQGQTVYAAEGNEDGTFAIPDVPPGAYTLVIWDKFLQQIMAQKLVTVDGGGGCNATGSCNFGDVPVFQWFAHVDSSIFVDDGGGNPLYANNGFWDAGELPLFEDEVVMRWRDGTAYAAMTTDLGGFAPLDSVFPFFSWMIQEVAFARGKLTGYTVWVDAGGEVDPSDPNTHGGVLNPQIQPDTSLPYRTEVAESPQSHLLNALQTFIGTTTVIHYGKAAYEVGENGGIAGLVSYDITRAEDEPVFSATEEWQPGIAGATARLWDSTGTILLNETQADSWDDSPPTGCVGDIFVWQGSPTDCFDGMRNFNQFRPGVFDGGFAFESYFPGGLGSGSSETSPIPPGEYIVEVVPPAGYEVVREESRNVDFGDSYVPSPNSALLVSPADCVGPLHTVPAELELFSGVPAHNAGLQTPLCTHKKVSLSGGQDAPVEFHLYTKAPVAAHVHGFVLDDLSNEFDPNAPNFGEKYAPPWMPVAFYDWKGNQIHRVYTDENGVYQALLPSTGTPSIPMPSGMAPAMHTACVNSPGHFDGTGTWIDDPWYNPQYSEFCYVFQYMPGNTTYLDTPVLPGAAHTGGTAFPLDCEYLEGTPRIDAVTSVAGGPWVAAADGTHSITITSEGTELVPNPAYDGQGGVEPLLISRDYGFGAAIGSVSLGGTALTVTSWSSAAITADVPAGADTGQLNVTRGDNSRSTLDGITVTVGGSTPIRVPDDYATIQAAIDNATAGDLILVESGQYAELVIMWQPVRLQGYGAGSTVIHAFSSPVTKLQAWRDKIEQILNIGAADLLPGQELLLGGLEPEVFVTEEGPGVMVLGRNVPPASGGYGEVGGDPNSRIDGFTITGADVGGGIFVNGYAHHLEISNNTISGNTGLLGGGIRVGHAFNQSVIEDDSYLDCLSEHVSIHNNNVNQNAGRGGAGGGISLHTGADFYDVTDNWVCGNLTQGNGGGIGQLGLANGGVISRNQVLFNETFHDMQPASGGGIYIGGGIPLGGQSPGTGSVVVMDNLIQGNGAQTGDGGGVRLERVNGQEITDICYWCSINTSNWYQVNLFNNMIVNNLAGHSGGGLSVQDAPLTRVVHNTITNNDSTATSGMSFQLGTPDTSTPQIGGIVAYAHTAELEATIAPATSASVDPYREYSNIELADNIIWHNRSFYFTQDPSTTPPSYQLLPDVAGGDAAVYNDLGVVGMALPTSLDPEYCLLTDPTGYDGSNVTGDPEFTEEYETGNRDNTVNLAEPTTIMAPPAFDEGGNFIRVRYGPLTLADTTTGVLLGDYHIAGTSPAVDAGVDLSGTNALLAADFDGGARPAGGGVDIGADESGSAGALTVALDKRSLRKARKAAKAERKALRKARKGDKNRKATRARRRAQRAARKVANGLQDAPRHGGMFQAIPGGGN